MGKLSFTNGLRWVAMLPCAFLSTLLVFLLCKYFLFFDASEGLWGSLSHLFYLLLMRAVFAFGGASAFVLVGAFISPTNKKTKVAFILSCFYVIGITICYIGICYIGLCSSSFTSPVILILTTILIITFSILGCLTAHYELKEWFK